MVYSDFNEFYFSPKYLRLDFFESHRKSSIKCPVFPAGEKATGIFYYFIP